MPLYAVEASQSRAALGAGGVPASDVMEEQRTALWAAFASAESVGELCPAWLALQCSLIEAVSAGLLLLEGEEGSFVPAAVWPDTHRDVTHLQGTAERALRERRGLAEPAGDAASGRGGVHLAYPIEVGERLFGVVVLDIAPRPDPQLQEVLRALHWGAGWLDSLFRQRQAQEDGRKLERARAALDIIAVALEERRLQPAAMAVVNELADRFQCERVTLGLERKDRLRITAVSHSAWFEKKTQLVAAITNAMEEAFDQHATVVHPPLDAARQRISVAHRDLVEASQTPSVCTVVMSHGGRPVGAITLERGASSPFEAAEVALCEAVASVLGPLMVERAEHQRWFAGRLVDALGEWRSALLGKQRPGAKLITALALLAVLFLAVAEGDYRVSAKAAVEGAVQLAAVAPFEGYVAEAQVRAGDMVKEGQVLATLDDKDLQLEAVRWESDREQARQKYRDSLVKHDRTAAGILSAQLGQAEAQLALVQEKLARTRITAPFDGIVVSGDLSQMLGSPVEQGRVLFEIAPLDAYRVILQVDDRDILQVEPGQAGRLALSGMAGSTLDFTVTKVTPVSTAEEGRNFFRVEARLAAGHPPLRPGMEGVGKIMIGQRKLLWILTHTLVDWLRLAFWTWLP
jgi:RND family efflux transporter MFP subunit